MMDSNCAIKVQDLSKKFCKNLKHSMVYGLQDIVKDWRGVTEGRDNLRKSEFWSLKDISFELKRGETLGIIGRNGAGKTTLLRMLNGIYPPDRGKIEVLGRISSLISSGLGFHRHFSGRQNIFISGAVRGMSQQEIKSKLDTIIDFAGIGDFIDSPVATYSKGMKMRLGFSIAVHSPIDILLIDEVLAVGDLKFRVKCYDKLSELKEQGVTVLLVSHVMGWITAYSDRLLLLDKGRVIHFGDVPTGVSTYIKDYLEVDDKKNNYSSFDEDDNQILKPANGTETFELNDVRFLPDMQEGTIRMKTGEDLSVLVDYTAHLDFDDVETSVILSLPGKSDRHAFQCRNKDIKKQLNIEKGTGSIQLTIKNVNLNNARVFFQFSITVNRKDHVLWWKQIPVFVEGNPLMNSFLKLDMDYAVDTCK